MPVSKTCTAVKQNNKTITEQQESITKEGFLLFNEPSLNIHIIHLTKNYNTAACSFF